MKQDLFEEIKKYKRLSVYNTKLTLTENIELISEAGFSPATTARELESALGKGFQEIMREFKIADMTVGQVTKLLERDAQSFEKELSKSFSKDIEAGFPKGTLGPAGKNASKIDLLRRISEEQKSLGRQLTPSEVDNLVREVSSRNKIKAAQFEPKIKRPKPNPKETGDAEKIVTQDPAKKGWDWKRLAKWGAGAGIAVGTLYAIYRMTHEDEPPIVTGDQITPSPTPTNGGGGKYTQCPETFPIKMYCKNSTVSRVQGCIGVKQDGAFGPITSQALVAKGVDGQSITQDSLNKVCGGNVETQPDPSDVIPDDFNGQSSTDITSTNTPTGDTNI